MSESSLIYVFPGQGSQKKGMGEGLFEQFPEITETADSILGASIRDLCLLDADERLGQTQYTQPALFTVNALCYLQKRKETGRLPDMVAGHSLGEYNALFAAKVFDFETGLKLVKKRGELMAKAVGGGMAAVIGLTVDQVLAVIDQHGSGDITIANYNSPQQTVITGAEQAIRDVRKAFEDAGARMYVPLKVSGAFHSPFMRKAGEEFESYLKDFSFNKPILPVLSNVDAAPYPPDDIASLLARQITSPVRWVESVRSMLRLPNPTIEEVGPGKVLKGLLRQITASD